MGGEEVPDPAGRCGVLRWSEVGCRVNTVRRGVIPKVGRS